MLRHAVRLIWLAVALHIGSSALAILGVLGPNSQRDWIVVDSLTIATFVILARGLHSRSRVARWLLIPAALLITPIVYPHHLLRAEQVTLWFTLSQGVVQGLVAYFALAETANSWFARSVPSRSNNSLERTRER
jgi:hypothetical protein